MRIRYTNYPNSKKLTNKSKRVATLTQPLYGIILGALPGIAAIALFPSSVVLPMILMVCGIIAGPILLSVYRKKKFAQLDAEYETLLQSADK